MQSNRVKFNLERTQIIRCSTYAVIADGDIIPKINIVNVKTRSLLYAAKKNGLTLPRAQKIKFDQILMFKNKVVKSGPVGRKPGLALLSFMSLQNPFDCIEMHH